MPNIKLVKVIEPQFDYYYHENDRLPAALVLSSSPWETVTDEELATLREWQTSYFAAHGRQYLILEEASLSDVELLVSTFIELAKKDRLKRERDEAAAKAKRDADAKKRQDAKIEKKRKQLEALQKELGIQS
jgi:hypothetical protein